MPPLSLLFSSNEETSRVLIQALQELEFQVEQCPEIFAAVQRLTSRKLDVIVADWDDGLEASFLLKTSRELKSNIAAFTVAVVSNRESEVAARALAADCILKKPFDVDKVKYALLTCDPFLAHMRKWLPKLLAEEPNRFAEKKQTEDSERHVQSLEPSQSSGRSLPSGPGSVLWEYSEKSRKRRSNRANGFLIATIVTTFLSGVYVFHDSREIRSVCTNVREAAAGLAASTRSSNSGVSEKSTVGTGTDSRGAQQAAEPASQVREVTAHSSFPPVKTESLADAGPVMKDDPLPSASLPQIPESLRSEQFARSEPRVGSALLDALEPVNITEDLSENLLLEKVQPSYPEQAVRSGLQGSVVLQALIGRDGKIQNLKLVRGSFLLGQSAYQAVRQWRYRPYLVNGRAVLAQTLVTVDFSLPTRSAATPPASR